MQPIHSVPSNISLGPLQSHTTFGLWIACNNYIVDDYYYWFHYYYDLVVGVFVQCVVMGRTHTNGQRENDCHKNYIMNRHKTHFMHNARSEITVFGRVLFCFVFLFFFFILLLFHFLFNINCFVASLTGISPPSVRYILESFQLIQKLTFISSFPYFCRFHISTS